MALWAWVAAVTILALTIKAVVAYIGHVRFVKRFPNPGLPYPLIGHANLLFGLKPAEVLPVVWHFLQGDGQLRKMGVVLGTQRMMWIFHPQTVEVALGSANGNSEALLAKSNEYKPLLPWLGTGLLLSSGPKWRARRKLLTPAFHFRILEDASRTFNSNADTLANLLLEDGKGGLRELDLFPYVCRCTLDIILESAMGEKLDVQNDRESAYAARIGEMLHVIQVRQTSPWLFVDWMWALSGTKRRFDACLEVIHGFTKKVIAERRKEIELSMRSGAPSASERGRVAFLDLLLSMPDLTDSDVQEEVDTFMFEGHDTTACALSWLLLLVANHPDVQDNIVQEQRDIFGDGADAVDADVTTDHLAQMKYLEACIKEALRLYPSVPIIGRHLGGDGVTIDGEHVPPDTALILFVFGLHRNPSVWDNPDEFRPERFLHRKVNAEKDRHPFSYVPFSAGPRNCIGQRFALMEEKTVLSKLLRKVRVEAVDSVEAVKPVIEVITRPEMGIRARFHPRTWTD